MKSSSGDARTRWRLLFAGLMGAVALLVLGFGATALVIVWGVYDVSATNQHLRPTFALLDIGLRRSVATRAARIDVPPLDDPALLAQGHACFRDHCEQCHGGPGVARKAFARGLLPVPSSLSQASEDWKARELYWITSKGIKMTAMPAWEYRLDETALWSIVAFLRVLPRLGADAYRAPEKAWGDAACERSSQDAAATSSSGDAERGRAAIQQYACTSCHLIPGIVGPASHTGPPLTAMGKRKYIGGVIPNDSDNMVRWLLDPQAVSSRTTMPDLGLTERHARDIAAYLEKLR